MSNYLIKLILLTSGIMLFSANSAYAYFRNYQCPSANKVLQYLNLSQTEQSSSAKVVEMISNAHFATHATDNPVTESNVLDFAMVRFESSTYPLIATCYYGLNDSENNGYDVHIMMIPPPNVSKWNGTTGNWKLIDNGKAIAPTCLGNDTGSSSCKWQYRN